MQHFIAVAGQGGGGVSPVSPYIFVKFDFWARNGKLTSLRSVEGEFLMLLRNSHNHF